MPFICIYAILFLATELECCETESGQITLLKEKKISYLIQPVGVSLSKNS